MTLFSTEREAKVSRFRVGIYGIVIKDNAILMVPTQSGTKAIVNFPGGTVDEGESFAQALIRECQEEMSCSITMGDYYDYQIWQHPDFPETCMFNIYYTMNLGDEPRDVIWVPFSKIEAYPLLPPDREIVNELMKSNDHYSK